MFVHVLSWKVNKDTQTRTTLTIVLRKREISSSVKYLPLPLPLTRKIVAEMFKGGGVYKESSDIVPGLDIRPTLPALNIVLTSLKGFSENSSSEICVVGARR